MRTWKSVAAAVAVVAGVACATRGASNGSRPTADSNVITLAEITSRAPDAPNAYQIVERLRPQMLRVRGLASPSDTSPESVQPKVYVDGVELGTLAQLYNVSSNQVLEIRYLNSRDATTRWGTGHIGGVILITTKR